MRIASGTGKHIAEIDLNKLTGAPAVAGYLLRIHSKYTVSPRTDGEPLLAWNIYANIKMENRFIGRAYPERPMTFQPRSGFSDSATFCFEFMVTDQTINALEQSRQGGPIVFQVEGRSETRDSHNEHWAAQDTDLLIVSQSDWISALQQMQYGKHMLFEVPLDLNPESEQANAIQAVENAKKHLYNGHYDDAVASCRKAMEYVLKGRELNRTRKAAHETPTTMSKEDRLTSFYDAIQRIAHIAAHLEEGSKAVPFSRKEAIMILGATASALATEE